jgi:hypothetical protein
LAENIISTQAYPLPAPGVVSRVIGEEAVLVQPELAKVKVLNEVGARIWSLADGTRTIEQIVALLCSEYQVNSDQALADTLEFISELLERGLLLVVDLPASAAG